MAGLPISCAMSGLPIEEGEEARVLLLTESPFGVPRHGSITDIDLWFPRTPPLRCVYDGHGGAEQVEVGPQKDVWMMAFGLDLVEGMDRYDGQDVGRRMLFPRASKDMSFDDMMVLAIEGVLWVFSDGGRRYYRQQLEDLDTQIRGIFTRVGNDVAEPLKGVSLVETPETVDAPPRRLRVVPAFIRNDVWDGLLAMSHPLVSVAYFLKELESWGTNDHPINQVALMTHFILLRDRKLPTEATKQTIGEFTHIKAIRSLASFLWQPSVRMFSQEVDWWMHQQLHEIFANIAGAREEQIDD